MFGFTKKESATETHVDSASDQSPDPLADTSKSRWERLWPVMACGAGLFSDGYINNVGLPPQRITIYILTVPGHWVRLHHLGSYIRGCLQQLQCSLERRSYYLCRHSPRTASVRLHFRQVVAQELPPRLDSYLDRLRRSRCWFIWLQRQRHRPIRRTHCISIPSRHWHWRRIPRWICSVLGSDWRTEGRNEKQMVYPFH